MIQAMILFVQQLLQWGGFRVSEFPVKLYRELLTALGSLCIVSVVIVPGFVELAKTFPGY